MEKELEKGTLVLDNGDEFGTVKIANDVVAMIASLAATEVDGVSAMAGNITNELMGKVGMKKLTKGVKVDILDKTVSADLAVTLEYGYNIPATCNKDSGEGKERYRDNDRSGSSRCEHPHCWHRNGR